MARRFRDMGYHGAMAEFAASVATNHAGFWRRFGALIVDLVVVLVVLVPASHGLEALGVAMFESTEYTAETAELTASASMDLELTATGAVVWLAASWLYFALMESGPWGATLGKRALGLRVSDLDGRRIGFGRASARYFAKLLSLATLFIGFAMAGVTRRKQALHDLIAGCLVLARTP
ncbi:MAG: RDD family protein [Alphaproteobacteria bacterium]